MKPPMRFAEIIPITVVATSIQPDGGGDAPPALTSNAKGAGLAPRCAEPRSIRPILREARA